MNKISSSFAQYPKYSNYERPSISDSETPKERRIAEIKDELRLLREKLQNLFVKVHGHSLIINQDNDYSLELLKQRIIIKSRIEELENELRELEGDHI